MDVRVQTLALRGAARVDVSRVHLISLFVLITLRFMRINSLILGALNRRVAGCAATLIKHMLTGAAIFITLLHQRVRGLHHLNITDIVNLPLRRADLGKPY